MTMKILKLAPEKVDKVSDLNSCLRGAAHEIGIKQDDVDRIFAQIPEPLKSCGCFLEKDKGIWRYEFGVPAVLEKTQKHLWGTDMWLRVNVLLQTLVTAEHRLTPEEFAQYMTNLANPLKHNNFLAEMMPALRLDKKNETAFEVEGFGEGKTTVDWLIWPSEDPKILVDVKYRKADLYEMMDGKESDEPQHDHSMLFRSVQEKFKDADPAKVLQGVWIHSQVAQEEADLKKAFDALDPKKVHFCILADGKDEGYVLARRPADIQILRTIFQIKPSDRFTFTKKST